jgi:protein-S-isoprenylcysteine O-methyltransferase Ste14
MTIKKLVKNIFEIFAKLFSFFVLYSSVITIILFPMLIISGFFIFLDYFNWISWVLADPTIFNPYHFDLYTCWLNSYLHISFFFSDSWEYVKILIFLIGVSLFILSLACLVIGILKNDGLVQERIYKHVRHPQNLAIIIMTFPLFLYYGFRIGDVVSWVQLIFLMIIYSDIADMKLKKKFPDDFQSYYVKTGFFLPRILPYRISYYFSAIFNKRNRYILLFFFYVSSICILFLLYLVLPFYRVAI